MPIKKVTFSFDVPIAQLLGLVVAGHVDMKISVFGDQPKPPKKLMNGSGQKLLPAPRSKRESSMQQIILTTLLHADKRTSATAMLQQAIVSAGYSPKSVSNQIFELTKRKLIIRLERNRYKLSAHGAKLLEAAHG